MMRTITRRALPSAALAALVLFLGCQNTAKRKIGFVVTTLSNPYFVTMTDAARTEAASHPGFDLLVQAPERAVDAARQLDLVDNMIAQRVNVLCIVPAD